MITDSMLLKTASNPKPSFGYDILAAETLRLDLPASHSETDLDDESDAGSMTNTLQVDRIPLGV